MPSTRVLDVMRMDSSRSFTLPLELLSHLCDAADILLHRQSCLGDCCHDRVGFQSLLETLAVLFHCSRFGFKARDQLFAFFDLLADGCSVHERLVGCCLCGCQASVYGVRKVGRLTMEKDWSGLTESMMQLETRSFCCCDKIIGVVARWWKVFVV